MWETPLKGSGRDGEGWQEPSRPQPPERRATRDRASPLTQGRPRPAPLNASGSAPSASGGRRRRCRRACLPHRRAPRLRRGRHSPFVRAAARQSFVWGPGGRRRPGGAAGPGGETPAPLCTNGRGARAALKVDSRLRWTAPVRWTGRLRWIALKVDFRRSRACEAGEGRGSAWGAPPEAAAGGAAAVCPEEEMGKARC